MPYLVLNHNISELFFPRHNITYTCSTLFLISIVRYLHINKWFFLVMILYTHALHFLNFFSTVFYHTNSIKLSNSLVNTVSLGSVVLYLFPPPLSPLSKRTSREDYKNLLNM